LRGTPFLPDFEAQFRASYQKLVDKHGGSEDLSWAVRSSATAEDLPDASFAGQQETFLNVRGIENILVAIKDVFASLYNDRAIAYRVHHKFEHAEVALSAGVQRMVRSDVGPSGVLFTWDTRSGFQGPVFRPSSSPRPPGGGAAPARLSRRARPPRCPSRPRRAWVTLPPPGRPRPAARPHRPAA